MAVLGYSFFLKSRMVNNCLLADTGLSTPITTYSWSRPTGDICYEMKTPPQGRGWDSLNNKPLYGQLVGSGAAPLIPPNVVLSGHTRVIKLFFPMSELAPTPESAQNTVSFPIEEFAPINVRGPINTPLVKKNA